MGPPNASTSAPPHSTPNHQNLHPTAKALKPNPPLPKLAITDQDAPTKQRHHSLSSSSEEEGTAPQGNQNDWQQIHRKKRKRTSHSQPTLQIPRTPIQNRYEMLTEESPTTAQAENPHAPKIHKPPPIFLHGVINYDKMIRSINEVAETEQFYTKSMANNLIKINCFTPETYRTLIKHFKDTNVFYHTYQLKQETAFRVVLKYLHHTTDIEEIRQDLLQQGHVARNIVNAHHRITKEPLNLFFIDLEPDKNNKEIYKITAIQNKLIHIEPPRTNKNDIPHCARCQQYGHKRRYCNRPYACVKCGGQHNSAECTKSINTPAKCALCGGNHPSNYKGCECYHSISVRNPHRNPATIETPQCTMETPHRPLPKSPTTTQQLRTYAEVVNNRPQNTDDQTTTLTILPGKIKNLFSQLVHQNSMILNMLTALLNKTH
jgi:hypothetical protein